MCLIFSVYISRWNISEDVVEEVTEEPPCQNLYLWRAMAMDIEDHHPLVWYLDRSLAAVNVSFEQFWIGGG